jgi:tetratricopeptide (TPR) repeat protein
LIRQVVGTPADWAPLGTFQKPQVGAGAAVGAAVDEETAGDPNTSGALGYYPPARALVVKGTSRVHTRAGGGLLGPRPPGAPPGAAMLDKAKKELLAKGGNTDKNPVNAAAKDKQPDLLTAADAKKLWQDALLKGVQEPGLIIAVTDYLAARGKFDHVVEFLKAELRAGLIARPWVYEALAIALQESKGSPDEIEQAQLSAIDLEPQDAQSFLRAAKAMGEAQRWDRALAFCKQAATLEPNSPDAYVQGMGYAQQVSDSDAMEWAASNLLNHDWPVDNKDLQGKAREDLKSFISQLRSKKPDEAGKMATLLAKQGQRDLVIELTWQGEADLDLEVKEPVGTVCSFSQRQTAGGGTLLGDNLSDRQRELYTAAQAFPGEYRITVNRIWGKPIGSKATVKIIEHQGTPQQTVRQETIVFDRTYTLKTTLKEGRRTSLAQVSLTALVRPKRPVVTTPAVGKDTLSKLRALADPTLEVNTGMKGGVAAAGVPTESRIDLNALQRNLAKKDPSFQVQVTAAGMPGMDFTSQTTLLPDGQHARVTFNPVFETVNKIQTMQAVNNPLIPGGQ